MTFSVTTSFITSVLLMMCLIHVNGFIVYKDLGTIFNSYQLYKNFKQWLIFKIKCLDDVSKNENSQEGQHENEGAR